MSMTREEAIKVLNGILHLNYRNFWDEECDKAIYIAIEALSEPSGDIISRADAIACLSHGEGCGHSCRNRINALPSAESDWIPCSEGLPEEGEKVLASTTNTVFTQVFKGTHGTSDSWWWNNNTIKTIYAWMPLPKPYRKDGET